MSDEQFVTPDSATRCASTQLPMTWDGGRWVHQDGACDDTNHFMHPEPALEVHELGEDGDCWIVVGTTAETHLPLVRIAVAKWLVETCGVEDGTAVEIIRDLSSIMTFYQYRDDWAYVPVHAEHPDDESYLRYGKDAPESVQRFAGTRVRL